MPNIDAKKIGELLPCPFCGGAAQAEHFESKLGRWRWSIGCNDHTSKADDGGEPAAECYGFQSMTSFATKAEAIAAWNRRASLSLASASDLLVDDVFGKVYAHCVIKYDPKAAKRVIREALTMPSKAETFYAVQELDIDGKYQWCLVEIRPQQRRVVENFGFGRDAESKAKVAMNKREFIESKSKLEDGREVSADAAPLASASEGEDAELCKRLEAYVAGVPAHRGLRTALDQTLCDALCRIRALENLAYSRDPFDPTKYGPPYKDCEQAALDQAREDALASNERERALSAQLSEARRERDEAQTILTASDRGSPIYKAVERVLDEHSAWISMPNRKVAEAIALASGIAWHLAANEIISDATAAESEAAALRERVWVLEKALEPFAEAATKGEIGGYPPNYFVGATEFENARRACTALEAPNAN